MKELKTLKDFESILILCIDAKKECSLKNNLLKDLKQAAIEWIKEARSDEAKETTLKFKFYFKGMADGISRIFNITEEDLK